MLSVLRQPHGRRLFAALAQSRLGTGAAYVALLLVAYERLRSPWAVTLVLLADFLPGIVLSPLCGALCDRYPRRVLVVAADLLSAGAFVALATTDSYLLTIVYALVAGTGTALAGPTLSAALGDMFGAEQRAAAGALRTLVSSLGITLGPAIAGGLTLFASPTLVLAINGATFAVSAALVCTIDFGRADPSDAEPRRTTVAADIREGVRIARRTPGVVAALTLDSTAVLVGGVINVAEPIFAIEALHAGASGYSALVSAYGAGMVLGSFVTARLGRRVTTLRRWWTAGIVLVAAGLIATAVAPAVWIAAATFALTGAGNAIVFVQDRIVQEITPPAALGRVFGLQELGANIAFVLASVTAGVLVGTMGSRLTIALAGGALLLVAAAASRRLLGRAAETITLSSIGLDGGALHEPVAVTESAVL